MGSGGHTPVMKVGGAAIQQQCMWVGAYSSATSGEGEGQTCRHTVCTLSSHAHIPFFTYTNSS